MRRQQSIVFSRVVKPRHQALASRPTVSSPTLLSPHNRVTTRQLLGPPSHPTARSKAFRVSTLPRPRYHLPSTHKRAYQLRAEKTINSVLSGPENPVTRRPLPGPGLHPTAQSKAVSGPHFPNRILHHAISHYESAAYVRLTHFPISRRRRLLSSDAGRHACIDVFWALADLDPLIRTSIESWQHFVIMPDPPSG